MDRAFFYAKNHLFWKLQIAKPFPYLVFMALQPKTPDGTDERIISTCFYAFNQNGYAAVSMDQIARELKISKKTIYKLFPSKEFILETAVSEIMLEMETKMAGIIAEPDGRATLYQISALYLSYREQVSDILRREIRNLLPHMEDRILLFESQVFRKGLINALKAGRTAKTFQYPSPTRETVLVILRFLDGILASPPDFREWAYKSFYRGFSTKSKKRK